MIEYIIQQTTGETENCEGQTLPRKGEIIFYGVKTFVVVSVSYSIGEYGRVKKVSKPIVLIEAMNV